MIIVCPCGKKKFEISENLIPKKGRLLKCGSCGETWFYNKNEQNDFYYGNLQEILKKNKISNMRILLNHVNSSQNFQINRLKKDTVIFNNILDFKSELKIIYLQVRAYYFG